MLFIPASYAGVLCTRREIVMNRLLIALCAVFMFVLVSIAEEDATAKSSAKLQIGVKKRVDNCPVRSKKGDFLHIHYTGRLVTGEEFDSSYGRGEPLTLRLGAGQVIKGWEKGLLGMCEGEKRKLVIPPELGYGSRGFPPSIPPESTLVFEVEMVKLERKDEL
ncbi:unnamed protein product [Cyprideis torosa]|uniref:peptidylprolyl isomerase n=1 Tax=Cyprideis torosa TaxID=163714 RepID=A0A7R8ZMK2_9CRUS|nr:unnamed protein product [Cyprideis torosa]CAG0895660.1 unnamed protein product [Cyprideis torosa]